MEPYNQNVTFTFNVVCFKLTSSLYNVNLFSFGLVNINYHISDSLAFNSRMTGNNLLESVWKDTV